MPVQLQLVIIAASRHDLASVAASLARNVIGSNKSGMSRFDEAIQWEWAITEVAQEVEFEEPELPTPTVKLPKKKVKRPSEGNIDRTLTSDEFKAYMDRRRASVGFNPITMDNRTFWTIPDDAEIITTRINDGENGPPVEEE